MSQKQIVTKSLNIPTGPNGETVQVLEKSKVRSFEDKKKFTHQQKASISGIFAFIFLGAAFGFAAYYNFIGFLASLLATVAVSAYSLNDWKYLPDKHFV